MIIYSLLFCLFAVITFLLFQSKILEYIVLFITSLLALTWYITDQLSGNGFNLASVYFLFSKKEGTGLSQFIPLVVIVITYLAAITAVAFLPKKNKGPKARGLFFVFIILGLACNPIFKDIHQIYTLYSSQGNSVQAESNSNAPHYHYVKTASSEKKHKNLIVLYLESFERAYSDKTLFGDITPNLNALRHQAIDIDGVKTLNAQAWTVAGLVNSQCGTPLVPLLGSWGAENPNTATQSMVSFLPKAQCVGDILKNLGYSTVYMGGADASFGNKGTFLRAHGFDTVKDLNYFRKNIVDKDNFSSWGVNDDILLEELYKEYISLSQAGKPFYLSALTLGTHGPEGTIAKECKTLSFPEQIKDSSYLKSIYCGDYLVSNFIKKIMSSPYFKDTILVVTSDHVTFIRNHLDSILSKTERTNNVLIFEDGVHPQTLKVPSTTIDTAATLVDLLKIDSKLGFGTSLLDPARPEQTLDDKEMMLQASSLWKQGSNSNTLLVKQNSFLIDGVEFFINSRSKLILGPNYHIKQSIRWQEDNTIPKLSKGDTLVYLAKCAVMGLDSQDDGHLCLWYSSKNNKDGYVLKNIQQGEYNLTELLTKHRKQTLQLSPMMEYSDLPPEFIYLENGTLDSSKQYVLFDKVKSTVGYGPFFDLPKGEYQLNVEGKSSLPINFVISFSKKFQVLTTIKATPDMYNNFKLNAPLQLKENIEHFGIFIRPELGANGFISRIGISKREN